jgi:hypothetical protein
VGTAHAEAGKRADCALVADGRGLDRIAMPHHGQQRDDPVVREIHLIDAVTLLLQDHALLQDRLLQVGREQCEVLGGQRRQQQIAPARSGAIQLHVHPFYAELDIAPTTRRALSARRSRPATASRGHGTCLCGIQQRRCENEV